MSETSVAGPMILRCPVCHDALHRFPAYYQCAQRHTFDMARQGYVNLLTRRSSRDPGDNAVMVESRRQFLNAGYYRPVADHLLSVGGQVIQGAGPTATILDIGCGEGYYTQQLRTLSNYVFGLDISKSAIRAATQRDKSIHWVVGNAYDLPFLNQSIALVTSIFSPIDFNECHRVLRPDGALVLVTPGENHLDSLRALVYPRVARRANTLVERAVSSRFSVVASNRLVFRLAMQDTGDIANLLAMTPYYWSASPAAQEEIGRLEHLTTTIDMEFSVLRPT